MKKVAYKSKEWMDMEASGEWLTHHVRGKYAWMIRKDLGF